MEASKQTIFYQGVEQIPAELPKDASQMFSSKLMNYIPDILKAAASS